MSAVMWGDARSLAEYLVNGESCIERRQRSGAVLQGKSTPTTPPAITNFSTPEGFPANSLPLGTLNAIDLNTDGYLWQIPFGSYPELTAVGVPETGSENYGGPVVTAGGLLFIRASVLDKRFHAFDFNLNGVTSRGGPGSVMFNGPWDLHGITNPVGTHAKYYVVELGTEFK
ncbi:hypothetical protein [Granulicella arctica]|uniref:hypothetical protein n=1 Tax=Granulicella arctica TaxID=940613 RepID=UPI0021E063AE|nr:hypothetical protein [Granulicella arctica]